MSEKRFAVVERESATPLAERPSKWIWDTGSFYQCGNCGNITEVDEVMGKPIYNYCPNCGARMVEEGDNAEIH